jgi:hypothetical protein
MSPCGWAFHFGWTKKRGAGQRNDGLCILFPFAVIRPLPDSIGVILCY